MQRIFAPRISASGPTISTTRRQRSHRRENLHQWITTVYVTVRALDTLGDLLDTVVAAGANTVNSIQFDVAEKDTSLKDARAEAVKDAQAKAQELAEAAGLQLGEIQSIEFIDSQPYPFLEGKGGGGADVAASTVPIQPGQLTFTVNVNVSYLLK